jgi:methionyl-tRNA formyltransferase
MSVPVRVVLVTEPNSKLGAPFLPVLRDHPLVDLVGLLTSPVGKVCSYFLREADPVDLPAEAAALGLPVLRPADVNAAQTSAELRDLAPDYLVVCNYQQIFGAPLLALPTRACINFHPSPLPRYAGLAPFYWMVRNGERDGAVSAIEMTTGIDGGPLIARKRMKLTGDETTLQLRRAQEELNIDMLHELLPQLVGRSYPRVEQDRAQRTYFTRPTEEDLRLDFHQDGGTVRRAVLAGARFPGARTTRPDGTPLVVLEVQTADRHSYRAPLAAPGTVHVHRGQTYLAAGDQWLHLTSVEQGDLELSPHDLDAPLSHGTRLGTVRL